MCRRLIPSWRAPRSWTLGAAGLLLGLLTIFSSSPAAAAWGPLYLEHSAATPPSQDWLKDLPS